MSLLNKILEDEYFIYNYRDKLISLNHSLDNNLNPYHLEDNVWSHICMVIDRCKDYDDDILDILSLFHDVGKMYNYIDDYNDNIRYFFNHWIYSGNYFRSYYYKKSNLFNIYKIDLYKSYNIYKILQLHHVFNDEENILFYKSLMYDLDKNWYDYLLKLYDCDINGRISKYVIDSNRYIYNTSMFNNTQKELFITDINILINDIYSYIEDNNNILLFLISDNDNLLSNLYNVFKDIFDNLFYKYDDLIYVGYNIRNSIIFYNHLSINNVNRLHIIEELKNKYNINDFKTISIFDYYSDIHDFVKYINIEYPLNKYNDVIYIFGSSIL